MKFCLFIAMCAAVEPCRAGPIDDAYSAMIESAVKSRGRLTPAQKKPLEERIQKAEADHQAELSRVVQQMTDDHTRATSKIPDKGDTIDLFEEGGPDKSGVSSRQRARELPSSRMSRGSGGASGAQTPDNPRPSDELKPVEVQDFRR